MSAWQITVLALVLALCLPSPLHGQQDPAASPTQALHLIIFSETYCLTIVDSALGSNVMVLTLTACMS